MVRPNDFGILWQDDFSFSFLVKSLFLPPSFVWEFSIKIVTTIGTLKKEKSLTPGNKKKMNDLVFIMYNLKIKEKRAKPSSTKEEIDLENLSSDDE